MGGSPWISSHCSFQTPANYWDCFLKHSWKDLEKHSFQPLPTKQIIKCTHPATSHCLMDIWDVNCANTSCWKITSLRAIPTLHTHELKYLREHGCVNSSMVFKWFGAYDCSTSFALRALSQTPLVCEPISRTQTSVPLTKAKPPPKTNDGD